MLSVSYMNPGPEFAQTSMQLLADVGKRRAGDQYHPARSAPADGSGGPARPIRRQHRRSHNKLSKWAGFFSQSRVSWIRDRHAFQRLRLRRRRLTAEQPGAAGDDTHELTVDRVWTPSSRSVYCGSGACPNPKLSVPSLARSKSNWLTLTWRRGKTDRGTQSRTKYRRSRFSRDPPSFARLRKPYGHRHIAAGVPTLPRSLLCACRTCTNGAFRSGAPAPFTRLRRGLEHVKNAANLKQARSNGAEQLSGSIA